MSNLISREEAIRAIISESQKDGAYGYMDTKSIVDLLNDLPSAQLEPEWTPCSERLPENDERVLATTARGDVTIASRVYPPINDTCWFIHDGSTNATIDDVVAWMPLPEPYREEGDS